VRAKENYQKAQELKPNEFYIEANSRIDQRLEEQLFRRILSRRSVMNMRAALFLSVFVFFLFSNTNVILAQQQDNQVSPSTQMMPSNVGNQEIDKENLEKLRNMDPEKVNNLDKKIEEALKLYNERKFGQALPIFKEIAYEVETMSIMWWLGTSAMNVGELNLAVEKFNKMLSIDPKLHRVRLELAVAYFQLGRYGEARKELETVNASKPPEAVQKNIDQLLAAIEGRTKEVFWNLRFSQGFMWDDNINGGPSNRDLAVIGGTLTLDKESVKISDRASVTSFSGNVLYDIKKWGLMWNTTADIYYKNYFEYSKFNFATLDVTTGPWWTGRQDIIKIPVGYTEREYGNDRLSCLYHVDPSYEHFFGQHFSLRGQFSYSQERYYADTNSDLNNVTRSYEIVPSIYLFNRQHILALTAGYTNSDADAKRYTYTAPYYGVSYFMRFPTKTEFFAKYQWTEKSYKDAPLLYSDERVDRQQSVTAVLSQEFYKYFFASYAFTYTKNDSNAELYTFNQTTHTVNVGFKF